MRILYVSQYYPPEMGAPAARVAELSKHWAQAGHDATVLTGFPNHPTGKVPREYRCRFRRVVAREKLDGVNIIRTWLLPFPNRKAHERMLNYSSFFFSSVVTGLFLSRPDLVIATSPQLLVGLAGWLLARAKRVPFVFEVRDLWPESLASVDMASADSRLYRTLKAIAGFLYRHSDRIVVVTPAFKDYLVERWKTPPEKILVVPNGVETGLFSPGSANPELRAELGADGKFVVSYIGTMGLAQGLETLLETAARLQNSAPEILFLLIGEGAEKERLASIARFRGLSNVRFIGQQPRANIPAYICASDACVVLLKKTELFQTVIPSKMLEFMACARPVILGVDGQARTVLDAAGAGIFVEPQSVAALADAVLRLASDSSARESLGSNGRRHVLQHFSRPQTATLYLALLGDLMAEQAARAPARIPARVPTNEAAKRAFSSLAAADIMTDVMHDVMTDGVK